MSRFDEGAGFSWAEDTLVRNVEQNDAHEHAAFCAFCPAKCLIAVLG